MCTVDVYKRQILGEFKITPFGVPHDSTDNVGYFVECGGVNFCLITDVCHITEEMHDFIGRANDLVLEANHLSLIHISPRILYCLALSLDRTASSPGLAFRPS